MKKILLALLLFGSVLVAFGQTKVDLTILAKPGANSTFFYTNASGATVWGTAASALTPGTGISISGNTITNSAPDQTVALTNGGGIGVTGTYPNFTLTATDASATNEIQTLTAGDGSGSDKTLLLNLSGGTVTLSPGTNVSLARTGNTITISASPGVGSTDFQIYRTVLASAGTTVTVSGFTPTTATTDVYVDGVLMENGAGNDYTLSGSVYTFNYTLNSGQKVIAKKVRTQ